MQLISEVLNYANWHVKDALDIIIVAFLLYSLFRMLRNTRAIPVVMGLISLWILSLFAKWNSLTTLSWLFDFASTYLIIAIIVVLQPELRRLFTNVGLFEWTKRFFNTEETSSEDVVAACTTLADEKIGALIIITKGLGIKQMLEGGIELNAELSRELLVAIFYKGNPLHDGAAVIEGNLVLSAATFLPMSKSTKLKRTHGARHRAALGISEETDYLSIVVSEERKNYISVCFQGSIKEKISASQLRTILMSFNKNMLDEEWVSL